MKLSQILGKDKITLSFEVFPPKTEANYEAVKKAALDVAALNPSYMSVTYGAGGSTRANTVQIASAIQQQYGITAISHLTCVGATKEDIDHTLDSMKEAGNFYSIKCSNNISKCCNRERTFCGKLPNGEPLKWMYYEDYLKLNNKKEIVK